MVSQKAQRQRIADLLFAKELKYGPDGFLKRIFSSQLGDHLGCCSFDGKKCSASAKKKKKKMFGQPIFWLFRTLSFGLSCDLFPARRCLQLLI